MLGGSSPLLLAELQEEVGRRRRIRDSEEIDLVEPLSTIPEENAPAGYTTRSRGSSVLSPAGRRKRPKQWGGMETVIL